MTLALPSASLTPRLLKEERRDRVAGVGDDGASLIRDSRKNSAIVTMLMKQSRLAKYDGIVSKLTKIWFSDVRESHDVSVEKAAAISGPIMNPTPPDAAPSAMAPVRSSVVVACVPL
jgi:hypothetical protein